MAASQASSSAPTRPTLTATVNGVTFTDHGLTFMNETLHSDAYAMGLLECNWHRIDMWARYIDMAGITAEDTVLVMMGSVLDVGMAAEKLGVDRMKQMVVLTPSKLVGSCCVGEVGERFKLGESKVQVLQNTDIRLNAAAGIKRHFNIENFSVILCIDTLHYVDAGSQSLFIRRLRDWYLKPDKKSRMVISRTAVSDEVDPNVNVMFKPAAIRGIKARPNIGGAGFVKFDRWSSRTAPVLSSLTNLITTAEVTRERQAFRQILSATGGTVREMREGLDRTPQRHVGIYATDVPRIVQEAQRRKEPPGGTWHQQVEYERKIHYVEVPDGRGNVQRMGEAFRVDEGMRALVQGADPAQTFVEHLSHGARVTWDVGGSQK